MSADRIARELAEIEALPATHDGPAYLVALWQRDWEAEAALEAATGTCLAETGPK